MARCGKEIDHTKSGQLRRRGQYRIQHVMIMIMMLIFSDDKKTGKIF